jgi:ABC-2 type transport system permease protein
MALAKNSVIRQVEYRGDLIGGVALEITWLSSLFLFYKTIFGQVSQVGSWNESEMLFFASSVFLVDALYMVLLSKNSQKFSDTIRSGIFDFYLLRPFSALFLSSFRYINVTGFFNLFVALFLAWKSGVHLSPLSFSIWFVYCFLGWLITYALFIVTASLAFWTTQTSSLQWLFFELYRLGHRPDDLYVFWLRRFLLVGFPAAFIISIPVKLALGKLDGIWFFWPLVWVMGAGLVAAVVWRRGLKLYEGALS